MTRNARTALASIAVFLGLSGLAAASYRVSPLYTANQNQYFIHGLARAGLGFLQDDWFAHTVDDTPVFSLLVWATYRYGHETLFYVYYALLLGLYVHALLGIVSALPASRGSRPHPWVAVAVIIVIHSAALQVMSQRVLHVDLVGLLTHGVAVQFIPGGILQPSLFGILLVLSLSMHLQRRRHLAVLLSAAAATAHPTYLLAAAVLCASFVYQEFRTTGTAGPALRLGGLALLLVLPILGYVYAAFRPTSPQMQAAARDIWVNAFPYHVVLARWLIPAAYIKMGIVLAAIVMVRRTPLCVPLAFSALAAVVLTVVHALSGIPTLTWILPWRLSVYLVPIASSVILATAATRAADAVSAQSPRLRGALIVAAGGVLLVAVVVGAAGFWIRAAHMRAHPASPMMRFVAETKARGHVYLIPVDLDRFRIRTGAPILVDWKAVPLKDVEVIEWRRRLELALRFYDARADDACALLSKISKDYAITHVVLASRQPLPGCVRQLYDDGHYRVYRLVSPASEGVRTSGDRPGP